MAQQSFEKYQSCSKCGTVQQSELSSDEMSICAACFGWVQTKRQGSNEHRAFQVSTVPGIAGCLTSHCLRVGDSEEWTNWALSMQYVYTYRIWLPCRVERNWKRNGICRELEKRWVRKRTEREAMNY